eukprot:s592_g4.t3
MRSAIWFFLVIVLIQLKENGVTYCTQTTEEAEGHCTPPLVSAQDGCPDSFLRTAAQASSDSTQTPFAGQTVFATNQTSGERNDINKQNTLEMFTMPAIVQVHGILMSPLPPSMAKCFRSKLCSWGETDFFYHHATAATADISSTAGICPVVASGSVYMGTADMESITVPMQAMPTMMPCQGQGPIMTMAMPAPSLPTSSQDASQKELIAYFRNRQADLPPDMQKKMQDYSRKHGARLTKDLQTAAKQMGDAKDKYEEALTARSQHIGTWKLFLAEAVKQWTEYGSLFEETSDEEEISGDTDMSAKQIKDGITTLSSSLQQLQKDAEAIKVEEPATNKRPRLTEPGEADVTMPGNGSVPFGQAGEFAAREEALRLALEVELRHQLESPHLCCDQPFRGPEDPASLRSHRAKADRHVGFAIDLDFFVGIEDDWKMHHAVLPIDSFACGMSPWSGCPRIAALRQRSHYGLHDLTGRPIPVNPSFADDRHADYFSNHGHPVEVQRPCNPLCTALTAFRSTSGPRTLRPDLHEVPRETPPWQSDPSGSEQDHRTRPRDSSYRFPAWMETIWNLLQDEGATEVLEEGPVIYLGSYYLSHETCTRQEENRPLRLTRQFEEWSDIIKDTWRDFFDPLTNFEVLLVQPEPPIPVTHGTVGILLIVQHPVHHRAAALTTAMYDTIQGPDIVEIAHSLPIWTGYEPLLQHAGALPRCQEVLRQGFRPCTIRAGRLQFPTDRPIRIHDGLGLVIRIPMLLTDEEWETQVFARLRAEHADQAAAAPVPPADPAHQGDEQSLMARRPHHHVRPSSSSSSSSSSSPTVSASTSSEASGTFWLRTVIFSIDGRITSILYPHDDVEELWRRVAATLRIHRQDIQQLFVLHSRPPDLSAVNLQGHLLQQTTEPRPTFFSRLALVDTEIYEANEVQPSAFRRKTTWVPHVATRFSLLRILGLEDLSQRYADRCRVWHNNILIERQQTLPLSIDDGDYIQVFIGREDQGFRCLQDDDVAMMIQVTPHARPDPPSVHNLDCGNQLRSFQECEPPTFYCQRNEQDLLLPERILDTQPAVIRILHRHWVDHATLLPGHEDQVLPVHTWFLDSPHHRRCDASRLVLLPSDFWNWRQLIIEAWRDSLAMDFPVDLFVVFPSPPSGRFVEGNPIHLLVLQREDPHCKGALLTVLDYQTSAAASPFWQVALFLPAQATKHSLVRYLEIDDRCGPSLSNVRCMFWHGDDELGPEDQWLLRHGFSTLLVLNEVRAVSSDIWADEVDENDLMQRDLRCSGSSMDPSAPVFQPGRPIVSSMPDFVQDLHAAWRACAPCGPGSLPLARVLTWYVDHQRHLLHCSQPREVSLSDNFEEWQAQLQQAWQDLVLPSEDLEFYVVSPGPPDSPSHIVGHVIIVQRPHEQLVTNLLTVYSQEQGLHGHSLQVAVTTHEHIYMEHLVQGVGYEQHCFGSTPTHHCEVWYFQHQLLPGQPCPGRSGMGLNLHIRPITPIGPVLLQLSTSLLRTPARLTHGPVAHTHGPGDTALNIVKPGEPPMESEAPTSMATVLLGHPSLRLPTFLEMQETPTSLSVQQELLLWGHRVQALDCHPHNKFFCIAEADGEQPDCHHYLFCHQDVTDEQGCFAHTTHEWLTENQLMRFLCSLGYARAVILEQVSVTAVWRKVLFQHQEPSQADPERPGRVRSPWPAPTLTATYSSAPLLELDNVAELRSSCILRTDFLLHDLHTLFGSAQDLLCTDFDVEGLPDHVRAALCEQPLGSSDLSTYDRLLIFTDGSSRPEGRRLPPLRADELGLQDTWAFLVLGECFATEQRSATVSPIGWLSHPVLYDVTASSFTGAQRIGSDQAERAAMTFAGLWRLAHNVNVPTVFCTDSVTTGGQAFGELGAAEACDSFRLLRSVYQSLHFALPSGGLGLYPVRAHAGDPYNDFVDFVAKREAVQTFLHPRQKLDLNLWRPRLEHMWMIFAPHLGLPTWRNGGFDVPAPDLPVPNVAATATQTPSRPIRQVHIDSAICLASANVQSLAKGPHGHGGKLHYLQGQLKLHGINCMGIQEARTEAGLRVANDVLCFASGEGPGGFGVELWINLLQPIGWQTKRFSAKHPQRSFFFQRSDFVVAHGDPRRLLVRCSNMLFNSWLLVCHAPHSGRPAAERNEWWSTTQLLLEQYCDDAPLFWLLDANAAPGEADGAVVHRAGFATSTNTPLFRTALERFSLCLPATTECHVGPNATWTAVDGVSEHCIDHIAVPQSWLQYCDHSTVLSEYDLAQLNDDHQVVALQLQWKSCHSLPPQQAFKYPDPQCFTSAAFQEALRQFRPVDWSVDVEAHADHFEAHLHRTMKQHLPQSQPKAKKLYVTDDIWQMRLQKLALRKQCKVLRRRLSLETLRACFDTWRLPADHRSYHEVFNYGVSLRCSHVRALCGFQQLKKRMKIQLQQSKQIFLQHALDHTKPDAPASELLRVMRPFIGPTNPKKQKRKTLPLIYDHEQKPCTSPEQAMDVWVTFFQQMEGGSRMSMQDLRDLWIHDLSQFRQRDFDLNMDELPTLTDVEMAFRRVPSGRARGPDHIPGEVCHLHASVMAASSYGQLMKLVLHGQEPLKYKGGCLTPAWKGKGGTHLVSSYRSLLVSSNLGKVLHRSVRQLHAGAYEHWLQSQQLGGRRHVPVQLALHQARAFMRRAKHQKASVGLLFLDLTEAFYRILRELTLGGHPTDELLAFVMQRLRMPEDSLHQLHAMLDDRTALQRAGLSRTAQNCIRAIHHNTHFWLAGQSDIVATYLGTRPGDSFADTIFGFTWSLVLKKLELFMEENGTITKLPVPERPPFFDQQTESLEQVRYKSYLGPTWMDDLCLCLYGGTPVDLEGRLGANIGYLLDLCEAHLMSPNLTKGKTELLLSFRGPGSRAMTKKYHGPLSTGHFQVLCEHHMKQVTVVKSYRHLGGQLHHTSDQCTEVTAKIAVAHAAFNQHRRLIYHNETLPLTKRTEFFNTLIITKLLYGADSWIANDLRTMHRFEAAVYRLYQRLLRWKPTEHIHQTDILVACGLPSPATLLRRARLRYLVVLFQCGLSDVWHLLCEDAPWIRLLEDDMMWMWQQLKSSSALQDPREHSAQWFDLLQYHPRYWKRLVNRACRHEHLQLRRVQGVLAFHTNVFNRLCDAGFPPVMPLHEKPADDLNGPFGCMGCGIRCKTRAGEAAHMFKKHGQLSVYRRFIDQTQCFVCLKEFHTYGKLKAHLYYSATCRSIALAGQPMQNPAPGKGSEVDQQLEHRHDRCLPPLQAAGPLPQRPRPRDWHDVEDALHIFMVDLIAADRADSMDFGDFVDQVTTWIRGHAISWTKTRRTLQFFYDSLTIEDAQDLRFALADARASLLRLSDCQSWPFLVEPLQAPGKALTIAECHDACEAWCDVFQRTPLSQIPRLMGRHRIILHAFAGRRRLGDLQYFLERDLPADAPFTLTVVSLDIVINETWGDVSKSATRRLWLTAIRDKFVVGFVAGPPCETWSRVRGVQPGGAPEPRLQADLGIAALGASSAPSARLPRVLRDLSELWGFSALAIKELEQILVGNTLLCFALEAIIEVALAGTVGILEHPAEPYDLVDAASIWRLPILRIIEQLPGVDRLTFAQGLLGAKTAKPTEFICVNLPNMMRLLHLNRVRTELPHGQSIGKTHDGKWHTSSLKEYSPALCKAMADAIRLAFDSCEVATVSRDPPAEFSAVCQRRTQTRVKRGLAASADATVVNS